MKIALLGLIFLLSWTICFGQAAAPAAVRIDPNPAKGFSYPYYLFVPDEVKAAGNKHTHTILVIPNNTGQLDDDLSVHENDVKRRIAQNGGFGAKLGTAILMPVFPRPKSDWRIYTQALDRDALITDRPEYKRFDLQLVAMIDDARSRLAKDGLKFDRRVLITGFSASGMFANRFVFLHPTRVKAAAIGSPGGWPIAPAGTYKEKALRYPIGTADFKDVSGEKLDIKDLRKVPLFMFIGDQDDNDSVIYGDSYEDQDKDLIFELFGKTPVERWDASKALYRENKLNAEFRLYPGVKHTITPQMRDDLLAFFRRFTS
jgi:dienelactone hydrolase